MTDVHLTRWSRHGRQDPRVVLVHGSTQGSNVGGDRHFSRQSRLAIAGWDVVVPDRPGHGRSPDPGRPDDPELDGAIVADLLGDGAHLVGHSFGGLVALAAATQDLTVVRSLTLIEPAVQSLGEGEPELAAWFTAFQEIMTVSKSPVEVASRFRTLAAIPADLLADPASGIGGKPSIEDLERVGNGLLRVRMPSRQWIEQALTRIADAGTPSLIVIGGWNPAIDFVARKAALLGHGLVREIKSPHHFPHLVSDDFNRLFEEFATGQLA